MGANLKRRIIAIVLAVIASACTFTIASTAANACSPSDHCYAEAEWYPSTAKWGVAADVLPSCLTVPSSGTSWANDEMWMANSAGTAWIEVGWKVQRNQEATWPTGTWLGFWADLRPGHAFV